MSQKITGLLSLEDELTSAESTALDEEQAFAIQNREMLQNKYDSLDPGPDAVKKFETAPLAAIGALMAAKKEHEDSWKKQEELDYYLTSKSLRNHPAYGIALRWMPHVHGHNRHWRIHRYRMPRPAYDQVTHFHQLHPAQEVSHAYHQHRRSHEKEAGTRTHPQARMRREIFR